MGLKLGTTLFLENGIYNDELWKVNQSKSEASSGVFREEVSLLQYTSLLNEFLKKGFLWMDTNPWSPGLLSNNWDAFQHPSSPHLILLEQCTICTTAHSSPGE